MVPIQVYQMDSATQACQPVGKLRFLASNFSILVTSFWLPKILYGYFLLVGIFLAKNQVNLVSEYLILVLNLFSMFERSILFSRIKFSQS